MTVSLSGYVDDCERVLPGAASSTIRKRIMSKMAKNNVCNGMLMCSSSAVNSVGGGVGVEVEWWWGGGGVVGWE